MRVHRTLPTTTDDAPDTREPPKPNAVYQSVTEKIVAALKQGVIPWRKPWGSEPLPPVNATTNRPYKGINHFILSLAPYPDHRWVTFKQAQELGGQVRKGERASTAIFWKRWEVKQEPQAEDDPKVIPLLRYFHIFNVCQCDGLRLSAPGKRPRLSDADRIAAAESLLNQMPDPPSVLEGGKRACYFPEPDLVVHPPLSAFHTPDAFYQTVLHEFAHATGHEKRLNRPGITELTHYGSDAYSFEELVAELASSFCAASIGLDNSLIDNTASYIQSWLAAFKNDPKMVVLAAGKAQRAADYICGLPPKYDA